MSAVDDVAIEHRREDRTSSLLRNRPRRATTGRVGEDGRIRARSHLPRAATRPFLRSAVSGHLCLPDLPGPPSRAGTPPDAAPNRRRGGVVCARAPPPRRQSAGAPCSPPAGRSQPHPPPRCRQPADGAGCEHAVPGEIAGRLGAGLPMTASVDEHVPGVRPTDRGAPRGPPLDDAASVDDETIP
jgi:hypothetical protein